MVEQRREIPNGPALSATHIDIWRTRLDLDQKQIKRYRELLSGDEIERLNRFRPAHKRREYIITRGLLRAILGHVLGRGPAELRFTYGTHGKPGLAPDRQNPGITFNASHSHNQAIIAVSLERSIGIDIERIRPDPDFASLARRFFSGHEADELLSLAREHRPEAFFACWTRKEAFVKAIGNGISYGLGEFTVSLNPREETVALSIHNQQAHDWRILSFRPAPDYIGAVAVTGGTARLRFRDDVLRE